jgi:predicted Zn finger-like uncharacterized protein
MGVVLQNVWQKQKKYFKVPRMILECPSCHSRFKVADAAIPAEGRTVKCSRCAHSWHAMRAPLEFVPIAAPEPMTAEIPEQVPAAPESPPAFEEVLAAASAAEEQQAATHAAAQKAPTRPPRAVRPYKIAAVALAASWLILAFITYFPHWQNAPVIGPVYGMLGISSTHGVALADVAMTREQVGQRTRFLIRGNLVNNEAAARQIPYMRVAMRGRDDAILWSRKYAVNKTLNPGEVYPFRITNAETGFGGEVRTLVVDVGHPLEMFFR